MNTETIKSIIEVSGYENGDLFDSPEQVRQYLTVDSMKFFFGSRLENCPWTDEQLEAAADFAIDNSLHMKNSDFNEQA